MVMCYAKQDPISKVTYKVYFMKKFNIDCIHRYLLMNKGIRTKRPSHKGFFMYNMYEYTYLVHCTFTSLHAFLSFVNHIFSTCISGGTFPKCFKMKKRSNNWFTSFISLSLCLFCCTIRWSRFADLFISFVAVSFAKSMQSNKIPKSKLCNLNIINYRSETIGL